MVNGGTVDNRLWIRGSALSEKLWNHDYYNEDAKRLHDMKNIIPRLVKLEKSLEKRGIGYTPSGPEFCAKDVSKCYS